ncbi:hypothetical protein STXM2123_1017 [Streptomyces sp. F-3]|nr:hypothetical protein STXM2123_1017 [Streptomyces sp. F-3]
MTGRPHMIRRPHTIRRTAVLDPPGPLRDLLRPAEDGAGLPSGRHGR